MSRRRRPRSSHTIYRQRGGNGWVLTSNGRIEHNDNGHSVTLVEYYLNPNGARIETHNDIRLGKHHNGVDRVLRRHGAELNAYPGENPEPNTPLDEQSRAVRMQRHAYDLYQATKDARGMSEAIAVRAAQEFGSTWSEKTDPDVWAERVKTVGDGRARRITDQL